MKIEDLTGTAKSVISEFEEGQGLSINPSFAKKQKDIIDIIDKYWMSKYKDGDTDSSGYRKAFLNIIKNPVKVASKMIDLDTKDVKVKPEEGTSYYKAWFLEKELRLWMKSDKNIDGKTFGQLLNEIVYKLPRYGHVLLKKAGDTPYVVPLQNIVCDQEANCFLDSDYIIEIHEYTDMQLRDQNWDKKKIEKLIATKNKKNDNIIIYEMHGKIDGTDNNYFIFPKDASSIDDILVSQNKKRKDLYKEIKWDSIEGRALGIGVAEELLEAQIEKNINTNLLKASNRWDSKRIFQTRDDSIAKNLMTDIENGDLLTINSEITTVDIQEKNLAKYQDTDARWDKNVADVSFSYESIQGRTPVSGTPLGTTQLTGAMAGMFYDQKREDLGMFLQEVIMDWIIPSFKGNIGKEHELMIEEFDGDELEKLRELIVNTKINKRIIQMMKDGKNLPSLQGFDVIKQVITEQVKKYKSFKIPKNFYDNLKYKIDIVITGEQIDMGSRVASLQTVLQILGSNPTILQDRNTKNIFYQLLDMLGISPTNIMSDTNNEQQAQIGGSIARPTMSQGVTNLPQTL